ncbi:MAG: hypothetical protein UIC64_01765, partial [Agathobacter sp.]|nr:hypothetical protein [Agathobacter sp.]
MSKIFEEFQEYLKKINEYSHVVTLLYWDMKTGMPKGGLEGHVNALTRFSTEEFKMSTSPELFEMLNKLAQPEEFEQLDDMWKFVVKEMKEDIPYKIYLSEEEMPTQWYNVRADMKNKPAPLLNPETLQPMTFEELQSVFCDE